MRTTLSVLFSALLFSVVPASAAQQPQVDARWSPWLGCWTPAGRVTADGGTTLCIVPATDGRGVSMRSFSGDSEVFAETLVVDGTPQALTEKNCRGERVSQWARTGDRFFSNARLTCDGEQPTTTSSVSAMIRSDSFLDVQVTTRGGREQVRVRRLVRSSAEPPAGIANTVRAIRPTRAVPAPVTADDVLEANGIVTPTAVEVWLAESGSRGVVDRKGLVRLADARVEERVIDLLVAMAYPQKFVVRRGGTAAGAGAFGGTSVDDGFYPGAWSSLADLYGYGFGAFGFPYFFNGWYYMPDTIYYVPGAPPPAEGSTEHGRVVNGQGYTRVEPREPYRGVASSGGSRGASSSGAESAGGSGGGSSSGSSGGGSAATPSGYSGGGGGGTGLTAVPR